MIDAVFEILGWISTGFVLGVGFTRWIDLRWGSRFEKRRARLAWPLCLGWHTTEAVEREIEEHANQLVPLGVRVHVRITRDEDPGHVHVEAKVSGRPDWRPWK